MKYTVYILKSEKNGKFYTGFTNDLNKRLERHNQGRVKSTKAGKPYKIIYTEQFNNREDAEKREFELKNKKGGGIYKFLKFSPDMHRD